MRYSELNKSILRRKNLKDYDKDEKFYDYLLKNNTAYLYVENISENPNQFEERILDKGSELNDKYHKTLSYLKNLCEKESIDFALFKTHKFIPEAVDGDIDLIVRKRDFSKLMDVLKTENFDCIEEGKFKGTCTKDGFLKLEPRSTVSYHGYKVLDEGEIWSNIIEIETPAGRIKSTSLALDTTALLLNVLYGPKYVRLYLYLMFKKASREDILSIHKSEDLKFLIEKLDSERILDKKFPIFLGGFEYMIWFFRYLAFTNKMSIVDKIRHFAFFYYSKLKYSIFGRLHFRHRWF